MNLRLFSLSAFGAALLLTSSPLNAAAEARSDGDGLFATPLLSRLLPNFNGRSNNLSSSPALNTRFNLSYFATGAGPTGQFSNNDSTAAIHLSQKPVRAAASGVAGLDYGPYYGASRLDLNRFSDPVSPSYPLPHLEESLGLSVEAGIKRDDLNAGILYAYRNNYSPLESVAGGASFPGYIFTPTNGAFDNALDQERYRDNQAIFFYLGYDLSQQLNLRGTLGLAKTSSLRQEEGGLWLGEQSRRWGVDIAATYKLLDNLVYEAHLGYVNIDENDPTANRLNGTSDGAPLSSGSAPTSLYHIGSHIRMTF